MKTLSHRENYRLEWDNIVISLINQGWSKGDAQYQADCRIEDKYGPEDEEEDEE